MLIKVITFSRARGIGNGLTYETDEEVSPGTLVMVPLRNSVIEGIVLETNVPKEDVTFDIKKVKSVVSPLPLLSEAQIRTTLWMSRYYVCSLRQLLQVFLPPPPWRLMLPKERTFYSYNADSESVKGKRQVLVVEFLRGRELASDEEIRQETGATPAVLKAMVKKGILTQSKTRIVPTAQVEESTLLLNFPKLTNTQTQAENLIAKATKPVLVLDSSTADPLALIGTVAGNMLINGKSVVVLQPDVFSSVETHRKLSTMIDPARVFLLHSRMTPSQRRSLFQALRLRKSVVLCGTRTALFNSLSDVGLIVLMNEESRTYKNEQTPRYHARLTAEMLCVYAKAKLMLVSHTPSLESWHHSKAPQARYELIKVGESGAHPSLHKQKTTIVDLSQVQFGKAYPFSPLLFTALDERLKRDEQSVLLLNRRGTATSILCLDCKQTIISPESHLPMTVHTVQGVPYLIDHYSGLMQKVPAHCPNCKSVKLIQVGAGTQGAEALLHKFFPKARVIRADADTLDSPEDMHVILNKMQKGDADILIGTLPVLRALTLPKVTLAAVVLADIGLSLPHFRAGERVFQVLSQLTMTARTSPSIRDILIQTFRPDIPEVRFAASGHIEEYLDNELALRKQTDYPPATQMICLIVRGPRSGHRAKELMKQAQAKDTTGTAVSAAPSLYDSRIWHVFLRGSNPRMVLPKLDLKDVIVDVDPVDVM